jgi:DNA-binding NtrC family response regulator|tara:strand:+ start:631 stop:1164 length:534 start_codon:yes stop_codon:yes gene_type:complete
LFIERTNQADWKAISSNPVFEVLRISSKTIKLFGDYMKKRKSALVVSESLIVKQEMRRMLGELYVHNVFEARDFDTAAETSKSKAPTFTFIDADSDPEMVLKLGSYLKSEVKTRIVFLKRKGTFNKGNDEGSISVLEKPVTLNRLNDVIHPTLSFSALIAEAQALIEREPATLEFQL